MEETYSRQSLRRGDLSADLLSLCSNSFNSNASLISVFSIISSQWFAGHLQGDYLFASVEWSQRMRASSANRQCRNAQIKRKHTTDERFWKKKENLLAKPAVVHWPGETVFTLGMECRTMKCKWRRIEMRKVHVSVALTTFYFAYRENTVNSNKFTLICMQIELRCSMIR